MPRMQRVRGSLAAPLQAARSVNRVALGHANPSHKPPTSQIGAQIAARQRTDIVDSAKVQRIPKLSLRTVAPYRGPVQFGVSQLSSARTSSQQHTRSRRRGQVSANHTASPTLSRANRVAATAATSPKHPRGPMAPTASDRWHDTRIPTTSEANRSVHRTFPGTSQIGTRSSPLQSVAGPTVAGPGQLQPETPAAALPTENGQDQAGGQSQGGTLYLDSSALGRWASQHLEHVLSRVPTGMTGIDPRASNPRGLVSPF